MIKEVAALGDDRRERQPTDRRRATIHGLAYGAMVHGRRRAPRRHNDTRRYYVDWYDERLFGAAIGIFLLCCLDAFFTLMLLSVGAEEINPFMAALLEHGIGTFVCAKLVITGFGVVFLVAHAAFRIADTVRVSHVLYALLGGYVTLFVYQVDMLTRAF